MKGACLRQCGRAISILLFDEFFELEFDVLEAWDSLGGNLRLRLLVRLRFLINWKLIRWGEGLQLLASDSGLCSLDALPMTLLELLKYLVLLLLH